MIIFITIICISESGAFLVAGITTAWHKQLYILLVAQLWFIPEWRGREKHVKLHQAVAGRLLSGWL